MTSEFTTFGGYRTVEQMIQVAQYLVDNWERIPKTVDEFCAQHGERFREPLLRDLQRIAGGVELYEESKKFLQEMQE